MVTVSFDESDIEVLLSCIRRIVKEELSAIRQTELKEKLYSPLEACKVFNPAISRVTLHKWATEGRLTQQKIGGRVWYKHSELLEAGSRLIRYKK